MLATHPDRGPKSARLAAIAVAFALAEGCGLGAVGGIAAFAPRGWGEAAGLSVGVAVIGVAIALALRLPLTTWLGGDCPPATVRTVSRFLAMALVPAAPVGILTAEFTAGILLWPFQSAPRWLAVPASAIAMAVAVVPGAAVLCFGAMLLGRRAAERPAGRMDAERG